MDSLVIPDIDLIRYWLDQQNVTWFECDACQALHLPHMQNFDGVYDAKIDLVDNVILFSALAEVKPTALIPLVGDLSQINASSLTVKAFVDIQDDNLPKLIVMQSLSAAAGITFGQFVHFIKQSEEQISMVVMEAFANHLLMIGDDDDRSDYLFPHSMLH
ncbi:YbjN domain-containing protein [Erwinia tracheiphila]|uniref:YbjN domain-containing protein n=1 Tax=Erwinia tracheiphila TaxID=65700 RepID=A0A345CS29_9GAMM|nr:YbjN domain-containing protein [Erwinia tracheiphila]AXF76246.1 YbjN domain-containing protein [Erwinia tracheiphila]UIA85088.1 YbjN domain-containing protein [Erwinia tracheiphila]UIA93689.1 YbjN domain-containing protein [Erwinia tracheiphila]